MKYTKDRAGRVRPGGKGRAATAEDLAVAGVERPPAPAPEAPTKPATDASISSKEG